MSKDDLPRLTDRELRAIVHMTQPVFTDARMLAAAELERRINERATR